jgi:hypothetical protein
MNLPWALVLMLSDSEAFRRGVPGQAGVRQGECQGKVCGGQLPPAWRRPLPLPLLGRAFPNPLLDLGFCRFMAGQRPSLHNERRAGKGGAGGLQRGGRRVGRKRCAAGDLLRKVASLDSVRLEQGRVARGKKASYRFAQFRPNTEPRPSESSTEEKLPRGLQAGIASRFHTLILCASKRLN